MRPPGAFKIAHRTRSLRSSASTRNEGDCSAIGSPSMLAGNPDPTVDLDDCLGPLLASDARSQRILDSLRDEILRDEIVEAGEGPNLRIRLVFSEPREIFRLELELPSLGYQRTTLLDREALEQLLEIDEVRAVIRTAALDL